MTARAALYARYSSDLQRDASIDDQLRICRQLVDRHGWVEVGTYADRAISGSTWERPELQRLLNDLRHRTIDVVVAESVDRLARDLEHLARIHKEARFLRVRIVTLAEGEVSDLHIGLKGTMAAMTVREIAARTLRGQEGQVLAGKSAGGKAYGYGVVRAIGPDGTPITGELEIIPAQADIVRRIFREYAVGTSARGIAAALNAEGIPAPGGGTWSFSTISGNWRRRTGILNNELYVGRRLWKRQQFVKDPASGARQAIPLPESEWVVTDVPHLRLVDEDLWIAVKERQVSVRACMAGRDGENRPERARRPQYLLSGLVRCGCCGASFIVTGKARFGCASARNRGAAVCTNTRSISQKELEERVLGGLRDRLLAPDLVEAYVAAYREEREALRRSRKSEHEQVVKALGQVERQIANLMTAIEDGLYQPSMKARLAELEGRKAELSSALVDQQEDPVILHPALPDLYRRKVASLIETLNQPDLRAEGAAILRGLIDEVRATPRDGNRGLDLELVGDLAAILAIGANDKPPRLGRGAFSQITMVAGTGFEPVTFRL